MQKVTVIAAPPCLIFLTACQYCQLYVRKQLTTAYSDIKTATFANQIMK